MAVKYPNPPYPYPGAPSPVLPPSTDAQALPTAIPAVPPPIRGPPDLADDLLQGAEAIAVFMFGSKRGVRQVYRLSTEVSANYRMPSFKLGGNTLCARKSAIVRWIAEQEAARRGRPARDLDDEIPY